MRDRKTTFTIQLPPSHQEELERWLRCTNLKAGLARRARVLLLLHHKHPLKEAARIAGLTARNARKWAKRYLSQGLLGLSDRPGRGRKPVFSPRGGPAPGQDGLRTGREAGTVAVPVGLRRTGRPTGARGGGRVHFRRYGAAHPGQPPPQALAAPPLAVRQGAPGCRLCRSGPRDQRPVYPEVGS